MHSNHRRGNIPIVSVAFSKGDHCRLRTPPKNIPSEFMTKIALTNMINQNLAGFIKNTITQIILEKRENIPKLNYFRIAT
jgi:hypothetical protein